MKFREKEGGKEGKEGRKARGKERGGDSRKGGKRKSEVKSNWLSANIPKC